MESHGNRTRARLNLFSGIWAWRMGSLQLPPGIREHNRRRPCGVDPVDGVWVKSRDRVGDDAVRVGD